MVWTKSSRFCKKAGSVSAFIFWTKATELG